MPILPENLGIRFEGDLVLDSGFVLVYQYEVYHKSWIPDTILETGTIWQRVSSPSAFASADTALQSRLGSKLKEAKERYRAIGAIGHSLHDTDLIWQHWVFSQLANGDLQAAHPLSGGFSGEAENTPTGRTLALLSVVPGPPDWAWADSPGAGQLRVKGVSVSGADHYNVYHDAGGGTFDLLGQVADVGLHTLNVEAGAYNVRLAAVAGNGRIGILSIPVAVTVEGAGAAAPDMAVMMDEGSPVIEPVVMEADPAPDLTRGDRLVRWLWGPERYGSA